MVSNNYFLLSGNGYPRIFTDILKNSISDINKVGSYNYLILCIDADENSIVERQQELSEYLEQFKKEGVALSGNCKLELVVQNRCIETWFLGNKMVYKINPSSRILLQFQEHYNVKDNDPELMPVFGDFDNHANFHFAYLKEMLLERNVRYTKNHPRDVAERHYLERLIERGEKDNHILSFLNFYNLCKEIKSEIK
ncbi:MAG: hypothetical protein HC917_24885 [Richelia sp. SM2_1_7]|nr:hypothetical protein [Richelia sp. SM2_1_7]